MSAAALVSDRRGAAFWAALTIGLFLAMLGVVAPARAVIPPGGEEPAPGEGPAGLVLTPDRTGTATPASPFTWDGTVATGLNTGFDQNAAGPCGKAAENYCDITLVNVVPGDFYGVAAGGVEFSTTAGTTAEDLDLYVYRSDAHGTVGEPAGASGGPTADERVAVLNASGYYLVVAVYYQVQNAGYHGRAEFFRRNRFPADVDDPRGFQESSATGP